MKQQMEKSRVVWGPGRRQQRSRGLGPLLGWLSRGVCFCPGWGVLVPLGDNTQLSGRSLQEGPALHPLSVGTDSSRGQSCLGPQIGLTAETCQVFVY